VKDPLGGINSLWPLFGIANQLLATVALCVATTIIIKMHRAKYAAVTLLPLMWLVAVTFTACWHKILDANPRVGFLAQARVLVAGLPTPATARLILNNRLDAAVTAVLVLMVALVLIESARQWIAILSGRREARVKEVPFVMTRLAEERI
jgi:carbon starvation protein